MEELGFYLGQNLDQVADAMKVNSAATYLSDTLSGIIVSSAAVHTELTSYFIPIPGAERATGLSDDEADTARAAGRQAGFEWDHDPMDDEDEDEDEDADIAMYDE